MPVQSEVERQRLVVERAARQLRMLLEAVHDTVRAIGEQVEGTGMDGMLCTVKYGEEKGRAGSGA